MLPFWLKSRRRAWPGQQTSNFLHLLVMLSTHYEPLYDTGAERGGRDLPRLRRSCLLGRFLVLAAGLWFGSSHFGLLPSTMLAAPHATHSYVIGAKVKPPHDNPEGCMLDGVAHGRWDLGGKGDIAAGTRLLRGWWRCLQGRRFKLWCGCEFGPDMSPSRDSQPTPRWRWPPVRTFHFRACAGATWSWQLTPL